MDTYMDSYTHACIHTSDTYIYMYTHPLIIGFFNFPVERY